MRLVKFTQIGSEEDYPVWINPEYVEQVRHDRTRPGARTAIISQGKQILLGEEVDEVIETLKSPTYAARIAAAKL